MTLPTAAAQAPAAIYQQSVCSTGSCHINICYPHPSSAANQPRIAAAVNRWDRQTESWTDRWTPDPYIDPALHTMLAALIQCRHKYDTDTSGYLEQQYCWSTVRFNPVRNVFARFVLCVTNNETSESLPLLHQQHSTAHSQATQHTAQYCHCRCIKHSRFCITAGPIARTVTSISLSFQTL